MRLSRHVSLCVFAALLMGACAQQAGPGEASRSTGDSAPATSPAKPKHLTIAIQREPTGFIDMMSAGSGSTGGAMNAVYIAQDALMVQYDVDNHWRPQLAAEGPAVDKGTWTIYPDGRMDVTWKLLPNVKWHDLEPFTSADLAFTFEVFKDPGAPVTTNSRDYMESVSTPDPLTYVVHFSQIFIEADHMFAMPGGPNTIMPRHLLDELYHTDFQAFVNSPRFNTQWVGLGPYKLVNWVPGALLEFTRFEEYYRGRPPLDAVTVKIISDPNTMIANILSGEVDAILPLGGPDLPAALELKHRWEGTGNFVNADLSGGTRLVEIQFRRELARPLNGMAVSVPVRQALYQAIDRQTLTEVATAGLSPVADSYYTPTDGLRQQLQIPQYPYDPARAQQRLAEAGWTRGADGILVQPSGERFETEVWARAGGSFEREMNIVGDAWKAVGVQVAQNLIPAARQNDREYQASYPGGLITEPPGLQFMQNRLHSTIIPSPANRWSGFNRGGYNDPRMDSVLDRLNATLDERDRLPLHRELLQLVMGEVATMPLYWVAVPIMAVKGVKVQPFIITNCTWEFYLWDRE
jgi:peptide/nickel transport system substrate-binding protein